MAPIVLGVGAAIVAGLMYLMKDGDKGSPSTAAPKTGPAAVPSVPTSVAASAIAKPAHPLTGAAVGAPIAGLPTTGPRAPTTITPPGIAQPPHTIINQPPAPAPVADVLHDVAAKLLQRAQMGGLDPKVKIAEVLDFQQSYNRTNPRVRLGTDGQYGAKTQAALQSVITPAVAPPPGLVPGEPMALVAGPPSPAPLPNPAEISDIGAAAISLANFFGDAGKTGKYPQVSTFQAAWNKAKPNKPVVVDGMYGGASEAAMQAVLNWLGQQQGGPPRKAPTRPSGAAKSGYSFP